MFYAQRSTIVEAVARRISNREAMIGTSGLSNLFDSYKVSNVLESIMSCIWSAYTKFGIAAAGVIAIIMIFQTFQFVLDTLIRGHTLYGAYGCSTHLLAAIWSIWTSKEVFTYVRIICGGHLS